ncbi:MULTISPECIES: hypothetical protein [unclassified Pseudoalteromonas]|uniref:hypothetical protein n=1 Tax=unclassified Pseudoalteromonas TaxID=194690 RepID=UPI0013FDFC73|nr:MULTISPECIES: hypothetical protein [unclassified Pseudoalteromonas]MBG9993329.1 hypothetical protein [Pseudoalteromonas sp. NZS37]
MLTSEPIYSEYSLEELLDCLQHIDQVKYPERYQVLLQEIDNRKKGIPPKVRFSQNPKAQTLKRGDGVIVKLISELKLDTSRLLKTIFILGCTCTLLAFVFTPQAEGYGNFIATIVFLFLCPFLLIYCIHSIKMGEIEIKSITVKRSDSPGGFWFGIFIYATFSTFIMYSLIWQTYT